MKNEPFPIGTPVHVNHYYGEIIEVVTAIEIKRPGDPPVNFALRSPIYLLQLDLSVKHKYFSDRQPIAHCDLIAQNGRICLFADEFIVRKEVKNDS